MSSDNSTIDLRSDTLTKPTPEMLARMVAAEVGDEQKGEDPTVIELEERVAHLLGHEAALFLPSASMANQVALQIHGRRGDELLGDPAAHIFAYELGGAAALAGLVMKPVPGSDGTFTASQLRDAVVHPAWYKSASAVVAVENTHAESGGKVWNAGELADVVSVAKQNNLGIHLDGARLLNAAVATDAAPADIARQFDTVTLCLSKGLGCPAGALLAMDSEVKPAARRVKQMLGGAMRQAGFLAAAGLYALEAHVDRLADDHANAHLFASRLAAAGVPLHTPEPATNIVLLNLTELHPDRFREAVDAITSKGVKFSEVTRRGTLRAVTHLDLSEDMVLQAANRTVEVLSRFLTTTPRKKMHT